MSKRLGPMPFGGIGSTLFIVFLVLKLTNLIDWSWWYVTAPIWAPLAVLGVIFAVLGVAIFCAAAIVKLTGKEIR